MLRIGVVQRFAPQTTEQKDYALALDVLKEKMAVQTQELTAAQKRLLAYAHPLREKIFTILTERAASPAEMTRELGLERKDLSNVNHHTKYLVDLGCAELVDERQRPGGPPEKVYKASARALVETEEWETLLAKDPGFADLQLGRAMQVQLDDFITAKIAGTIGRDADFHMSRTRRVLDVQGLAESLELKERHRQEEDEIERRAAERRSTTGEDAITVSDCLAFFKVPSPTQRPPTAQD